MVKRRDKRRLHLALQLADYALKLGLRFFKVGYLLGHIVVSRLDLVIFIYRIKVDGADMPEFILTFGLLFCDLGSVFICYGRIAEAQCVGARQLIVIPEFACQLVVFFPEIFKS